MPNMNLENADSRPYWEAAREGRLVLQRCEGCGHVQFPPRHLCETCWGDKLAWVGSNGRGTIESVTIVHRAPTPDLRDEVPYAVGSIILEDGPRMITNIVGDARLEATIGDPVAVTFKQDRAGRVLPQFERAVERA